MYRLVYIDWSGPVLTDIQRVVVLTAAVKYLREGRKVPTVHFSHSDCDGVLKRGKEGVYGTFGGTFFKADLGTIDGKPHTCDFLIPRGVEELELEDGGTVILQRITRVERGVDVIRDSQVQAPKEDSVKLYTQN